MGIREITHLRCEDANQRPRLPGWTFDVAEVSAGVYMVTGTAESGQRIEKKGIDPDALLEECAQVASSIDLEP